MSATRARAASTAGRLVHALRARVEAGGARPALRRPGPRAIAAAVAALVLLLAGWFWLRDSSLVAVRTVEITGVDGPQNARVRAALEEAARSMTTLHVRQGALDTAAEPFAIVKRVEASTDFPHTLRIHVVTNVAVGAIVVDGRRIAVTSDGTILRDVTAPAALPQIPVRATPAGARLTERAAVSAVAALGAAPPALRTRVASVRATAADGLELQLAHGPLLVFGSPFRLAAKWAAAAAVLADPQSAGMSAIDVTAPERPAVSGLPDGAPATGESDIPTLPQSAPQANPTAEPQTDPTTGTTLNP
ncbi:MAG: cell division protein FtsQ/DivIB [Conexibacter sp.]